MSNQEQKIIEDKLMEIYSLRKHQENELDKCNKAIIEIESMIRTQMGEFAFSMLVDKIKSSLFTEKDKRFYGKGSDYSVSNSASNTYKKATQ